MAQCKNCSNKIKNGNVLGCLNCGATVCLDCGEKTHRICPYCYSTLEFIG